MSNYDQLLQFVAGNDKGNKSMSRIDNDVISWMLLSSDLLQNGEAQRSDLLSDLSSMAPSISDSMPPPFPLQAPFNNDANSVQEKKLPSFTVDPSRYPPVSPSMTLNSSSSQMTSSNASDTNTLVSETLSSTDLKKQQRLEKNREIARNCRKRKREKFEMMESEVKRLREENTELKFLLLRGRDSQRRETERLEQFEYMKKNQDSLNDKELGKYLKEYYDSWQDYGEGRRRSITFHLDQLKGLLLPSQLTKLIIWSFSTDIRKKHMSSSSSTSSEGNSTSAHSDTSLKHNNGDHESHSKSGHNNIKVENNNKSVTPTEVRPEQVITESILKDTNLEDTSRQLDIMTALESFDIQSRDGFWNLICKVMDMTEEQQKAILSVNPLIRKQRNNVKSTINLLAELQETINHNLECLQNMVTRFMNILDPHQQVKLLEWIEANQVCMYMLNTFWNNNTN